MIELNLKTASDQELIFEIEQLVIDKKKLLRQVDDIDTKIIGVKEEQRWRKAHVEAMASIMYQDTEDTSF